MKKIILLTIFIFTIYTVSADDTFLMELSKDTFNYLSSDWATSNNLPWSWKSTQSTRGDYANTAEIGFYMLSWLGAYEMDQSWSPSWSATESEITSILNRLEVWQSGSQTGGPHAYDNSVFYQWYWINQNPPRVGDGSDNHLVPSIDNAWLAASLITIEEYAKAHGKTSLANKAQNILKDMDFSLWYHPNSHRFTLGAPYNPQGGIYADYYSNENRIINFIARVLGDLNETEYKLSLNALQQPTRSYDGIEVEKANWDGSYFTYASPGLFIKEHMTDYGTNTIDPATLAQITYASDQGYPIWGISDCYATGLGDYLDRGAPPRGSNSASTGPDTGIITPHASALALITSYSANASQNLENIKTLYPSSYNNNYGFLDSIDINTNQSSSRFVALDQEWLFLSLMNYFNETIWKYFYMDEGVQNAHKEICTESVCDKIFKLYLGQGWNMISIPLILDNTSPEYVFRDVDYDNIFSYGAGWKIPSVIDYGSAIWVEVLSDSNLMLQGSQPQNITMGAGTSWSMVGYPFLTEKNITEIFDNIILFSYNGSSWKSYDSDKFHNTLTTFTPGSAYWIKQK